MGINPIDFIKAVRARAAAEPDKVYEIPDQLDEETGEFVEGGACVYVEIDQDTKEKVPSCLIGCALADLEVPLAQMEAFNENSIYGLDSYLGLELPQAVVEWASRVQNGQDDKRTWSDAIEFGDERATLPAEYQEVAA